MSDRRRHRHIYVCAGLLACGAVWAQTPADAPTQLDFGRACANEYSGGAGKGVVLPKSDPAHPLTQPAYPPVSLRMGEAGRVVMELKVNEVGKVAAARVATSSGYPALDAAALEESAKWTLQAGQVKGKPACMWHKFAVTFVLEDSQEAQLPPASPLAQKIAPKMLGLDKIEVWLSSEVGSSTASERALMTSILEGVAKSEWVVPFRDYVGSVITARLSGADQSALLDAYADPQSGSQFTLSQEVRNAVLPAQRVVALMVSCQVQAIDAATKEVDVDELMAGDSFSPTFAKRIPDFVSRAITYCDCAIRRPPGVKDDEEAQQTIPTRCGKPPSLTETAKP